MGNRMKIDKEKEKEKDNLKDKWFLEVAGGFYLQMSSLPNSLKNNHKGRVR